MGFCSVLIEPQGPNKSPSYISVAQTFSLLKVIVVQSFKLWTPIQPYDHLPGHHHGEFTPLSELLLEESYPPALLVAYSPTLSDIDLSESALSPKQGQALKSKKCHFAK